MSFWELFFIGAVAIFMTKILLNYHYPKDTKKLKQEVNDLEQKLAENQAKWDDQRNRIWSLPVCDFVSEIVEDIWANTNKYSVINVEIGGYGFYSCAYVTIARRSTDLDIVLDISPGWVGVKSNMGPELNEREQIELATACKYVYDWHTRNEARLLEESQQRQRNAVIAQIRKEKQNGAAS